MIDFADYVPGDRVQVLTYWAHGMDPHWFGGYIVERVEPLQPLCGQSGPTVLVRDTLPGALSGMLTRRGLRHVRFDTYGPKAPEEWQKRPPWQLGREKEPDPEGSPERLYRGWRLERY